MTVSYRAKIDATTINEIFYIQKIHHKIKNLPGNENIVENYTKDRNMNFFGIFEYSNLRRRKRRKLITDQHHIKDKELEELHILRLVNHN